MADFQASLGLDTKPFLADLARLRQVVPGQIKAILGPLFDSRQSTAGLRAVSTQIGRVVKELGTLEGALGRVQSGLKSLGGTGGLATGVERSAAAI